MYTVPKTVKTDMALPTKNNTAAGVLVNHACNDHFIKNTSDIGNQIERLQNSPLYSLHQVFVG